MGAAARTCLDYIRSTLAQSLTEVLVEVEALEMADSIAARELEQAASDGPAAGNIVYGMNQVRGRVALRQGRLGEAVEFYVLGESSRRGSGVGSDRCDRQRSRSRRASRTMTVRWSAYALPLHRGLTDEVNSARLVSATTHLPG